MPPEIEWPEVGSDALDPLYPRPGRRRFWLPRRRPVLGVRSTVAPSVMFIVIGAVLGPHGANVLSFAVLERLDLAVSVALAVLGVFVGLGLTAIPKVSVRGALVGAVAGSLVTAAIVAAGLGVLLTAWRISLPVTAFTFAGAAAICATASAAVHLGTDALARRAAYLADMDDVPVVILGALVLAALGGGGLPSVVLRLGLTVAGGAAVGLAGWLLFDRATGPAERGVFVTGAVLLLAGMGAYLGTSALLTGAIAALVWVRAPGEADRITGADLRVLQHPLVSLLLIVAGALVDWTRGVLWITVALVLLRLTGKLVASFAVAPILRIRPGLAATALLPPGVLGIALALNFRQVLGTDSGLLVATVTAGAAISELLAAFLPREGGERR
jgi:hypothetical protein